MGAAAETVEARHLDIGDDEVHGGPGTDRLIGGKGENSLAGGPGKDTCGSAQDGPNVLVSCELAG